MRPTSTEAPDDPALGATREPGASSTLSGTPSGERATAGLGRDAGSGSGESIDRHVGKHVAGLEDTLRDRLRLRERRALPLAGETAASVLIALFVDPSGELRVWLLRKIETLRRHGGQVALPGGKRDPGDATPLETALREAEEEIGLLRSASCLIGDFDDYVTSTGYVVWPHVVFVDPGFTPVADPNEVARVFSAELACFLEAPSLQRVPLFGADRDVPGYRIDGETVWGATSAILQDVARVLLDA